jgi:hypothetical protein
MLLLPLPPLLPLTRMPSSRLFSVFPASNAKSLADLTVKNGS